MNLSDDKDMFEYGSDQEVVKFLSWGPHETVADARYAIKEYFLMRPKKGLPVGYAIVDTKDNKMIGTIDYHTLVAPDVAELGYVLNRKYWNKGIMSLVINEVIKVGFHTLGYKKITIRHLVDNIASQKVIEKAGFKYVKEGETYDRFTGGTKKTRDYELTQEDLS